MKPSEVAPVDQSGDSKSVTFTNGTSAHAGDDKLASNNNANKILDNVCNGVKMKADTHTLSRQDVEFASNALLNPIIRDESRRSGRSRSSTPIPSSLPRSGTPNPSQAGSLTQNTLSSKAENTETIANATGVSESQKNIGSFPPWSLKNKKTVSQIDNLLEKVVDENSEDRSSSERSLSHGNDDRTSNADSARSSAERSVDSVDSSSSRFSQKSFGPRARKSGVCSTKGATKPSNVGALSNVTIKLPDFDNPIQLDSRTLEKINRLESKHRSGPNKHVPKKAVPSLQPTESSSVQAKQKQKPHGRRRKNRSGTYLLPTEIRKLKNMKRKSDMDSKNKDDTDSVDGTASSTGAENVSESCPSEEDERMDYDDANVKTSASKACLSGKPDQSYIACDTNYNSTSAKADSSSIPSSSLSSVVSSSSSSLLTSSQIKQEVVSGEKEHVWEIFRTNNMTKTKNTLGSIRAGRPRKSENKGGGKDFKGKTLDSYLEKMHKTNPTEKQNEKDSLIEEISNIAKKRKLSGSDSEKSKENGFKTNSVHPAEDSGKKPRVDEGPKTTLIKVINTPQVQSGNMRSLLPKNIMALANPSKSPGTPHTKMILLQTSTDTFCSNSKNTFAVVSKPVADSNINAGITTSVSLLSGAIVHTPLLLQKGENLPRMASAKKMPVLAKMLPDKSSLKKLEAEHDSEKENSSDSLPSSLSYPVTPPKTPEDQQSEDSYSVPMKSGFDYIQIPPGPTPPDKDVIPLCCCKINGASFKKLGSNVTYCQALDSIDGKVMGCCNKVTSLQLVRPGVKIPFMAICEVHRKRLRQHQCCPGCGHFCMQGKFYHCRKDGALSVHYFHKQCQVIKGGKYYCPHCGEESYQIEVSMTFEEALGDHVIEEKPGGRNGGSQNKSKMSIHPNTYRTFLKPEKDPGEDQITASHRLTSNKVLHNGGVPIGPDKASLERVLSNLNLDERPKKFKNLPKCLYNPAYEKDLDKVLFMLVEGVNPDEKFEEFDNQTALHAAAMAGSLPIVHLLVQTGASIHCADKELKTPLMYAAENNHPAVVRYLLKLGADVTAKADDGMTVLHYAAKAGHVDVLKVLMEADKIDINVQDDGGWTPIIWASEHKLVKAVKFLTKHGADPHLKDKEENTSLHWASYSGSVDIAELFLNAGCDLEAPNEHGDRPLHIAARQDHYECVVLFLARGADVDAKNNENDTPIQCCLNENSQVALALAVNRTLKGFAINRLARPQKLVHRDVSMGRENIPIPVVNEVDDDTLPTDFQYVTENTETSDLNINRTITSLQSCRCQDDCSSMFCVCGRNSVKCWYDRSCKLLPEFNMSDPPLVFECNKGCRCWSTCNNRVVQMGITSRLQMFKTIGRGWGVKSLLDIPKGSFVTEYIGELISDSEADSREDDSYLFDLDNRDGDTYCIDARRYGNISRFINHLCEPNLIPVKVFVDHQDLRFPRICLFASRDIKAHEELGFDYGEKFWMIKWKQFTCTCGSPKCKYSSDVILKTVEDYKQRHEEEGSAN